MRRQVAGEYCLASRWTASGETYRDGQVRPNQHSARTSSRHLFLIVVQLEDEIFRHHSYLFRLQAGVSYYRRRQKNNLSALVAVTTVMFVYIYIYSRCSHSNFHYLLVLWNLTFAILCEQKWWKVKFWLLVPEPKVVPQYYYYLWIFVNYVYFHWEGICDFNDTWAERL